jgi:class 3 adenylate cyclase/response regulator of citrate/malate metabolism
MTPTNNDNLFADDDGEIASSKEQASTTWKVFVIDDEPSIEIITKQSLRWSKFDGFGISIVSARSGLEARALVDEHPDIAVILLDVVMETQTAGLDFLVWLRKVGKLPLARVLLRTGQAGQSSETEVVQEYDIHDYLHKTEITATRMRTSVLGALRSYKDLKTIELHRKGLEQVLSATSTLFNINSGSSLVQGVLSELSSLLLPTPDLIFFRFDLYTSVLPPKVIAATGKYEAFIGKSVTDILGNDSWPALTHIVVPGSLIPYGDHSVYILRNKIGGSASIIISGPRDIDSISQSLMELYCRNAAMALDNQALWHKKSSLIEGVNRFVPQKFLDMIGIDKVEDAKIGQNTCTEKAVMFCDVLGFTSISDKLPPNLVFSLVNQIFGLLTPEIEAKGGIIDKYLGDGIMAIFNDSTSAVCAAVAMQQSLDMANSEGHFHEKIAVGIGLHFGPLVLGIVGTNSRMDTTVIADTVNVSARIEKLTRKYKSRILLSEDVVAGLDPELASKTRFLGFEYLRGKEKPMRIAEVFTVTSAPRRAASLRGRDRLAQALEAVENGDSQKGLELLIVLAKDEPDDTCLPVLIDKLKAQLSQAV